MRYIPSFTQSYFTMAQFLFHPRNYSWFHLQSYFEFHFLHGSFNVSSVPLFVRLSYFVHRNEFPPMWVLSCAFKWPVCEKVLSHFEHLNGLSPVWILSWVFKWTACEKLLLHLEHWYGFSPVWVLSCFFKSPICEKFLSHFVHLNRFSQKLAT